LHYFKYLFYSITQSFSASKALFVFSAEKVPDARSRPPDLAKFFHRLHKVLHIFHGVFHTVMSTVYPPEKYSFLKKSFKPCPARPTADKRRPGISRLKILRMAPETGGEPVRDRQKHRQRLTRPQMIVKKPQITGTLSKSAEVSIDNRVKLRYHIFKSGFQYYITG